MRRRAGLICAWTIFCLAAVTAQAQEIVKFQASQPNGTTPVDLRAELYRPTGGGPFPAVILLHGCDGWQAADIFALHKYAQTMRDAGYVVLNLDSFGPRSYSGAEMCGDNARLRQAIAYRTADVFDAARYLRHLPYVDGKDLFLMGQSNGGSVAIAASLQEAQSAYRRSDRDPPFRAAVALYPWCGLVNPGSTLATPVQVFSGGRDEWVSANECVGVRTSGAEFRVKVYPAAVHSFDLEILPQRFAGFMIDMDPQAAADSRHRMMRFFDQHRSETRRAALP
ncbi:MAG: dienelactone hydrolase family protein [Proteobacteria bacterium]|nr:dienelactone hydrolase family protein [Pseudomonadota bacterium]